LGAVRRLACEAADCGLLSADLAAGIRRVKGVKKLGIRLGNWLTAEQAHALWQAPDVNRSRANAIVHCSPYCSPADFADTNLPSCPSVTSSSVRAIGQSWTCVEKLVTFEQFRFQIGYMAY
jgi:hypothetical protein